MITATKPNKRRQIYQELRDLWAKAEREKRDLTTEERARFAELELQFDEAADENTEQQRAAGVVPGGIPTGVGRDDAHSANRAGSTWIDPKTGLEIRTLRPDEKLADLVPRKSDDPPLSFGKYFRGLITGNWTNADAERRAMSEGVLTSGGNLVPSPLAAEIIDAARAAAVTLRAGAVTVPMDSQTLSIARLTGDPTASWHSEAGTITPSDMSFDRVTLTAKTLAAICGPLSVELIEDAPNCEEIVRTSLAKVLATEVDRAALVGSGTAPEPKGIRNQTNVTVDATTFTANGSVISNAAPTGSVGWAWLAKMIAALEAANETPNAAIWHPRTGGELDQLVDTTGQPLRPLPSCEALLKLQTSSVPINLTQGTNNDASLAFVGDFTKLMIGMRTDLVLEVSRIGNVGATSLFSTLQVGVRAYLRADVAVSRPTAFRVMAGIR